MPEPDREFQQRLLETFRGEAEEHVHTISAGLIELENTVEEAGRVPIIERIFREAHSLKGAARAVSLRKIETICQSVEQVFSQAKRGELVLTAESLDGLHGAMDEVEALLQSTKAGHGGGERAQTSSPTGKPTPSPETASPDAPDDSVRVSAGRLDRLLLQVEELVPAGMGAAHRSAALRGLAIELVEWKRQRAKVQSDARSLRRWTDIEGSAADARTREATRLLDFLSWSDEFSGRFGTKLDRLSQAAEQDQRSLSAMTGSLLRDTKTLLLRPFSSLTEGLPKLVRDLCRAQGKEATLNVSGAEIQIDRRVLQEIKDPLMHLLRNCVDHGIEMPEVRARANKAPHGVVSIAIEQKSADRVEITVSDDGAGIDLRGLREAVVTSGLVPADSAHAMNDSEILAFVFQSGVSTSPIVTEISGRGLGGAIVREKVDQLGGDVTLDTRLGEGTTFRLLLPMTVSTIRGILIRLGEQRFIIPVTFVEKVASTKKDSIQTVKNQATVLLGDRAVSYVRLHDVLGLPADRPGDGDAEKPSLVVVAMAEKRIAFGVDEIVGEQEALAKSLGSQLAHVRNFGGAAVLGTGEIVPILSVADLMKSAAEKDYQPSAVRPVEDTAASRRRSVLVVDDSITARTLLRNILEAAGYVVKTAVDGSEAFATLHEGEFDLVLSDVEMPRMSGFDLTARIRADTKLSGLPVILLTALESPKDRERGIDVGANAYVVKSSFEQNDLLDIVRRFA